MAPGGGAQSIMGPVCLLGRDVLLWLGVESGGQASQSTSGVFYRSWSGDRPRKRTPDMLRWLEVLSQASGVKAVVPVAQEALGEGSVQWGISRGWTGCGSRSHPPLSSPIPDQRSPL